MNRGCLLALWFGVKKRRGGGEGGVVSYDSSLFAWEDDTIWCHQPRLYKDRQLWNSSQSVPLVASAKEVKRTVLTCSSFKHPATYRTLRYTPAAGALHFVACGSRDYFFLQRWVQECVNTPWRWQSTSCTIFPSRFSPPFWGPTPSPLNWITGKYFSYPFFYFLFLCTLGWASDNYLHSVAARNGAPVCAQGT